MTGWLRIGSTHASDFLARSLARLFYFSQRVLKCAIVVPRVASQSADSREFIEGYSDTFYWIMLNDAVRKTAYESAATNPRLCRGKRFLDIGTGARLPLSTMVLRGGAAQVDAIEGNARTHRRAAAFRESLEASMKDRIRLHRGLSTEVELSRRNDGLIHELVGTIASCEGMVHCIADAQERLLVTNALIIPSRVATALIPVEMPPILRRSAIASWIAAGETRLDQRVGVQIVYNSAKCVRLNSTPVVVEEFDCAPGAPAMRDQMVQATHHTIAMERDGWFSGFLLACHIVTGEGSPTIDGLNQLTNWGQVYAHMVEQPVPVTRGETLHVEFRVDAREFTPSYRLAVAFPKSRQVNEIAWKGPAAAAPARNRCRRHLVRAGTPSRQHGTLVRFRPAASATGAWTGESQEYDNAPTEAGACRN
jgi:hypothetical protein